MFIFLDYSNAFDTVDHNILLKEIENCGIRGIAGEWFSSYLTNRKQFVFVTSDQQLLTCRVPQGDRDWGPYYFWFIKMISVNRQILLIFIFLRMIQICSFLIKLFNLLKHLWMNNCAILINGYVPINYH